MSGGITKQELDGVLVAQIEAGGTPPNASLTQKGIVQLADSVTNTSADLAVTANTAKYLNDIKVDKLSLNPLIPVLKNGWISYDIHYWKDALGYVHLIGTIGSGNRQRLTAILNLPIGYRPSYPLMGKNITLGTTGDGNETGYIYGMTGTIDTNGDIQIRSLPVAYIMLDMVFYAGL